MEKDRHTMYESKTKETVPVDVSSLLPQTKSLSEQKKNINSMRPVYLIFLKTVVYDN